LGVLLVQITSAASGVIRVSNRHIDAAAQARLAFDRIGRDLGDLIKDGQTDFSATNAAPGNASLLQFVSAVTSAGSPADGNRCVSVVAYQVNASADNGNRLGLLRAGKPVGWDTTGFRGIQQNSVPVSFGDPSFPAGLLPSVPSDFDVLAPGVLRMVAGFQLYPDDQPVALQDGTTVANARGQVVYSPPVRTMIPAGGGPPVTLADLGRVSALVVGVVTVDPESLKLLTPGQVQALSDAFANVPATDQLPVAKWMADTASLTALPPAVPLPARQAVRVYQRAFPVTPHLCKNP